MNVHITHHLVIGSVRASLTQISSTQNLQDFRCHDWEGLSKATGSSSASGILGTRPEWLQDEEAIIDEVE